MKSITITNPFHSTQATIQPHEQGGRLLLSAAQEKKLRTELCGQADCRCWGSPAADDPEWRIVATYEDEHLLEVRRRDDAAPPPCSECGEEPALWRCCVCGTAALVIGCEHAAGQPIQTAKDGRDYCAEHLVQSPPAEWATELLENMSPTEFEQFLADPDSWEGAIDHMSGESPLTQQYDAGDCVAVLEAMTVLAHARVARVRRRVEDHMRKLVPAAAWPVVSTLASELGISDK